MATMAPYRAYYSDTTKDPYNGTYVGILNEYEAGANSPQELRNKVYASGNAGRAMSHLLLIRDPNQPGTGPGKIVAYHRATRYDARIGQTTPFDDVGYSFLGDVHERQPPFTVVLPDDLFNQATAVQVPTAARMDQLLAADATAELFGPFLATDNDVEAITVRKIMYVPPKYMLMAMDSAITPRQAWTQIRGAIVADGKENDCIELIKWLRVCLTRRATDEQPRTSVEPPTAQPITDPQQANTFLSYRLEILHQDHPELSPSQVGAGAQAIADNIADLATETRRTREEADPRRVQESNKTAKDLYGPSITRLLRFAQVTSESALQPIHNKLAKSNKHMRRHTLQAAIDAALADLGYHQDFPITSSITKKVLDLAYYSNVENDFAVGLNVFCVGPLEPEDIEAQRRRIAHTDAIDRNDASPSLSDMSTILDPSDDVCIPKTLAQLKFNVQKYHSLLHVLLGSAHQLVAKVKNFHDTLNIREHKLERATPRNRSHRYIAPALIGRRLQLDANYWFQEQALTSTNVPIPDLSSVFREIALKKDWAPDFPEDYVLTRPAPQPTPVVSGIIRTDEPSQLTEPTGAGTDTTGTRTRPRSTFLENPAHKPAFDAFRDLGHTIAKVKERCRANNIELPKNNTGKIKCLAYHVKGACNERCIHLDMYVDADFCGLYKQEDDRDPNSVKSRTRYIITLGGWPIIWKSSLHTWILTSTFEAEYTALSTSLKTFLPRVTTAERKGIGARTVGNLAING